MNIVEAKRDPQLLQPWFSGDSWNAWRAFDKAFFGLPMDPDEMAIYEQHTGGHRAPLKPFKEVYLICGRRGGKSINAAAVAVFIAAFKDHSRYLRRGEDGVVMVIAADQKQSRIIPNYIKNFLAEVGRSEPAEPGVCSRSAERGMGGGHHLDPDL